MGKNKNNIGKNIKKSFKKIGKNIKKTIHNIKHSIKGNKPKPKRTQNTQEELDIDFNSAGPHEPEDEFSQ